VGLALTLALIIALSVAGYRLVRRLRLARRLAALPGATADNAMPVASFDQIDQEIARRRCVCGGRYDNHGESSSERHSARLRVASLECRMCERRTRLYFDVSNLYH
jgi:hypothetical protein